MQTLILTLSANRVNKRILLVQRLAIGLIGIINLGSGILMAGTFRYVTLAAGIGGLAMAICFRHNPKSALYSFTDAGIERPESKDGIGLIPWSDVAYMEHAPLRLTIDAKNGSRLDIDLGSLSYQQHKTIVPQILRFAKAHNVGIRTH
jgi:hypothetical protein